MKKFILITVLCLFTLQCEQGWIKDTLFPEEEEELRKMIGDLQEQVKSLKTDKNSLLKEYKGLKSIVLDVSKKFEKINLSNAKLIARKKAIMVVKNFLNTPMSFLSNII